MNGLLPAFDAGNPVARASRSPHDATIGELVQALGTTIERRQLLRNLIAYRQILQSDGYRKGVQFIDGSFVENVEAMDTRSPGDIDIVSFLAVPEKYTNGQVAWDPDGFAFWTTQVADRNGNKQRFSLDTYAHLMPTVTYRDITYWHGLFSHQRDTFRWKGYVAVMLDGPADQAALSELERA
jgi:hypothetical protein